MSAYTQILNHTDNNVWEYYDDFSGEVIALQMSDIEKRLLFHDFDKALVKKVVRIFIELAQNIQMHSAETSEQHQYRNIVKFEVSGGQLTMSATNLAPKDRIVHIQQKVNKINTSDPTKLNEMYVETLRNLRDPAPKGAGLGLIDIARKTRSQIQLHTTPIDEHTVLITFSIACK